MCVKAPTALFALIPSRCLPMLLLAMAVPGLTVEAGETTAAKWKWPVPDSVPGTRYQATVPDTLDLADRAELSLRVLTGILDPDCNYELYFLATFQANPPYMSHERTGLPTNNPKFAESLPMMRLMCGSNYNRDIETRMMEYMVSAIGDDGFYYAIKADRPWHEANQDFANVYGNIRFLLAMKAWYHVTGDPAWKERIDKLVNRLCETAIYKGDYAFYPTSEIAEWFSYGRNTGWLTTDEPAGHPTVLYIGPVLRGLAQAEQIVPSPRGRELANKLSRFLRKPVHWQPEASPKFVDGPNRAQWQLHFHGWAAALRGLLDYAMMTRDADSLEFVRDGYEYARSFGIPRIGFFPEITTNATACETCCIADMVALAIKLSEAGVGDYWDDVDRYVRNQLVEQQYVDAGLLKKCAATSPPHHADPPLQTSDNVIERNLGGFAGWGWVAHDRDGGAQIMHCCTGNGTQALYYAWDAIVRHNHGLAQVNLLLNRASPWMDIDSYLPYEGKVVLKNKTAQIASVRMPRWVDRSQVSVQRGGKITQPVWSGGNVVCTDLAPDEVVTIMFPVKLRFEKAVLYGKSYTFHFRGNTVVDMEPKDRPVRSYPFYEREHMKADKAPLTTKQRFVSDATIPW